MALKIFLFLSCVLSFCALFFSQETHEDIVIGKKMTIHSEILKEDRSLLIYLPQDYDLKKDRYPVLFLLDGNWHFHHVSGIVQFFSWAKKHKGMIIVGLPNTRRGRDLSPAPWPEYSSFTGGADDFIGFLKNELIPYIDRTFRTGDIKILAGHSLAGTFSLYCFLTKPEIFDAYISLSPCLFWHDRFMLKKAENFLESHERMDKILYISHEYTEGSPASTMKEFEEAFQIRAPEGLHWTSLLKDKDDHFTYVHKAIYDGLEHISRILKLDME